MKLHSFLAISLFLLLVNSTPAQEWKETKLQEGNFKAMFPGDAKHLKQKLPTDVGQIEMHIFAAEIRGGNEAYMVFYNDYPANHVRNKGAEAILRDARDGAINQVKGKVSKESKIMLAGRYPGREFHFQGTSMGKPVTCSWRLYIVGNRMYQLGVIGVDRAAPDANIKKFFDSFAHTKN